MLPTSECDFDNLKIELSVSKFRPYNRINQTFRIIFSYFNVINSNIRHLCTFGNSYTVSNLFVPSPTLTEALSVRVSCLSRSFLVTLHTANGTSNNFKIQQNDEETDIMRTGRMGA